jgi:hypothetical protein
LYIEEDGQNHQHWCSFETSAYGPDINERPRLVIMHAPDSQLFWKSMPESHFVGPLCRIQCISRFLLQRPTSSVSIHHSMSNIFIYLARHPTATLDYGAVGLTTYSYKSGKRGHQFCTVDPNVPFMFIWLQPRLVRQRWRQWRKVWEAA